MKRTILSLILFCAVMLAGNAQTVDYRVVPLPQTITPHNGTPFTLDGETKIVYSGGNEMKRNAQFLAEYIKENVGLDLKIVKSRKSKKNAINLVIDNATENKEGYSLTVTSEDIKIVAQSPAGIFYGIQTLRKSLPTTTAESVTMPAVTITDYPRFAYRGAHLDVSRHYFTTDSIKRFIDILALHNVARNYIDSLCSMDISTVDGVQRNEELARAILRSYARNISTLAKKSNMLKDVVANFETVAMNTFDSYLNAFQRLFVIQDIPAWCPAIRSASAIRSGMKREFCDPSIAVTALGLTPQMLEMDLKTFGFIFETMCIRDLKAYSQSLRGSLAYYHDRYDLETDAVLRIANGQFALIEFKLGSSEIEEGAMHLIEVQNLIREYNKKEKQVPLREPDLLIVITGGQLAYTREDGVKVIPLACLRD